MKQSALLLVCFISFTVACEPRCIPGVACYRYLYSIRNAPKTAATTPSTPPVESRKDKVCNGAIKSFGDSVVGQGEDAILQCLINTTSAHYSVVWYHEQKFIAFSVKTMNDSWDTFVNNNWNYKMSVNETLFSLHLSNVSFNMSGNYTWQVQEYGTPVAQESVQLKVLPVRFSSTAYVEAHRGDNVILTCDVAIPDGLHRAEWLRNGDIFFYADKYNRNWKITEARENSEWTLRMQDVQPARSANYTCKVYGPNDRNAQIIMLRVLPTPRYTETVLVNAGQNATLACNLNVTDDLSDVFWFSQKHMLVWYSIGQSNKEPTKLFSTNETQYYNGNWKDNDSILYITNVTAKLAEEYICWSQFSSGRPVERKYFKVQVSLRNGTVVKPDDVPDHFWRMDRFIT